MRVRYSISTQHGPNRESDSFIMLARNSLTLAQGQWAIRIVEPCSISTESRVTVKLKLELFFKRKAERIFERPVIKYGKPLRIGTVKFLYYAQNNQNSSNRDEVKGSNYFLFLYEKGRRLVWKYE